MSTDLARKLRRNPPEPERRMWAILHSLRRQGYNFRRQAQIGSYYADFACRHPALIIEVDGETHTSDLAQSNDAARDDYFAGRGYRVLRFWNNEVMENAEGVYTLIVAALAEISRGAAPPTLDPSPQRGRESTASPGAIPTVVSLPDAGSMESADSLSAGPPVVSLPLRGEGSRVGGAARSYPDEVTA